MINIANAQADSTMKLCSAFIAPPFVSDGQQYQALVNNDETAEFYTTFYGGAVYRIAAATGLNIGNVIFTVYDENKNELFTNKDYKNAPYWDFYFSSSINCIIEARLDTKNVDSGIIYMLIGFKQ